MPPPLPPGGKNGKPPGGNPELPSTDPLVNELLGTAYYVSGGTVHSVAGFNNIQALPGSTVLYPTAADARAKTGPHMTVTQIISAENPAPKPPGLSGLSAIGDFFGRLTEASTWLRVGQVVLGVILVAVGVARITHAVPAATRIAKTVGAVAI